MFQDNRIKSPIFPVVYSNRDKIRLNQSLEKRVALAEALSNLMFHARLKVGARRVPITVVLGTRAHPKNIVKNLVFVMAA